MAEKKYIELEAVLEFVEPDARPFLAKRIKSIPAADVRPVRRGRWQMEDDGTLFYRCSACGKPLYGCFSEIYMGEAHFCPNCGADMREES